MADHIQISPEFEQLSQECDLLKEEFAALFAEWEHLTKTVIPNIEAEYAVKIGVLHHELLLIKIDIQRTRREAELIQAAINRGANVDPESIEQQLENEFSQWKAKLDAEVTNINAAKLRLSTLMSQEDSTELRKLYRALAKKLHPDVNPNQSQDAQNVWLQVQSAYEMGDLTQLQALGLLVDDLPENYDLPSSIDLLKKRRNDLKLQIKTMLQKLAELKSLPLFQWEECLDSPQCVAEEQNLIREQIDAAKEQREAVQAILDQLKTGRGNE